MYYEEVVYLATIVQQLNIISALLVGGAVVLLLVGCYKFLRMFI